MANKKIGQAGLNLIKKFEGCRLSAYRCAAGVWTIGYGHTANVHSGMSITQAQADTFLKQDCEKFEQYVNNRSYVPFTDKLNQNQFDALVSFAFNLGQGNLKKLCANRTISQIPAGMQLYCKAAGKTLPGLQRRRKEEAALFEKAVSEVPKVKYRAGDWYRVKQSVPVCNGYYGEQGRFEYLSNELKMICEHKDGIAYLSVGADVQPIEVREFDDTSVWMKLDATIACLAVGVDGEIYVG